jgi:hypothetical protein
MDSNILKVLTELSFDNLFVIVGLGFIAVAVFGSISGKIAPDKRGRIASGFVGAALLASGLLWHMYAHGFRFTVDMPPTTVVFSGGCPTKATLPGIIEANGVGDVIYYFAFTDGTTTPPQRIDFDHSESKLVSQEFELTKSLSGVQVQLNAVAPKETHSRRTGPFNVACVTAPEAANSGGAGAAGAGANQPGLVSPAPAATPPPPASPPEAIDPNVDSVQFNAVNPPPGTHLQRGNLVPFNIDLTYNLVSADTAILSVSTAQIRSTSGCSGSGELVDAIEVPISRGTHKTRLTLTWSGDTGLKSKGRIYGQGSLGFDPMFWASNNGSRGERLKYFGINTNYCYSFGP